MANKTRIGILGLGGVGGYFGGLLAEKYFNSEEVEIIFIVRPATEKILKEKGLKLITPQFEKTIFPDVIASDTINIGELQFLICCIKSYDLEESLLSLKNSVSANTVILPLLNGVDASERIQKLYPEAEVWKGCTYIISKLLQPGVVEETGKIHSIYFGKANAPSDKISLLENILKSAGIDAFISENIETTIWQKFVFISSVASLTSYLNIATKQILENEVYKNSLIKLINEVTEVAVAKNIQLPEDIVDKAIQAIERLPPGTTSSMQRDFAKGGKTEYISLTKYVTELGNTLNIATPEFDKILATFQQRQIK